MALKHSYALLAPLYDPLVARATLPLRRNSIHALAPQAYEAVLLPGIGTGLDIPFLPEGPKYTGIDITHNMLVRAQQRAQNTHLDLDLHCGDCCQLPYAPQQFGAALLHLILAVVPEPATLLKDVTRVLKSGARLSVVDKFLKPQQTAPIRRLLNPVARHLATRLDVVFEDILAEVPELRLLSDRPVLAGGWFRHLMLEKL